ncbi:hypothetical protein B0H14DRAFT_2635126 [Mycena olivaceomarginata]|nr:hypothetical protein B0H14DRAFT_2635126 [Mycena olivaceomarginata]
MLVVAPSRLVSRCAINNELPYFQKHLGSLPMFKTLPSDELVRTRVLPLMHFVCFKVRAPSRQSNKETARTRIHVRRYSTFSPSKLINVIEVSSGSIPLKHASTYGTSSGHLCIATVHTSLLAVHRSCQVKVRPGTKCHDRIFAQASSGTLVHMVRATPTLGLSSRSCSGSVAAPLLGISSTFESGFIADTGIDFISPNIRKCRMSLKW